MYFVCVCVCVRENAARERTEVENMTTKKNKVGGAPAPASAGAEGKGGSAKEIEKDYMGAKVEKTFNEKGAPVRWVYEWDGGDIKAEIYRVGQCHISLSDDVTAQLKISLRAEKNGSIVEKYNFGSRVLLLNYPLKWCWGGQHEDVRYDTTSIDAKTWREAFERLENILMRNIQNLLLAIEARKKALEEAER